MAIYTRFGSEVKIVSYDTNADKQPFIIRRIADGKEFLAYGAELKADGGVTEIMDAVKVLENK